MAGPALKRAHRPNGTFSVVTTLAGAMSSRDDDAKIVYGITLYESPYMAYGLTEATNDQFQEWCEARSASCLREANFGDLGDELFIGAVPRRYSDEGLRRVDEQRLMGMVEGDFIELALQKHRQPKKDDIQRCLWSNEKLSSKADSKVVFDERSDWSFWQRQGLEPCYVEVKAHQWNDPDHPDSACDGSDIIAVNLTIVFGGGRTERARLSTRGTTNSWLPNELAVAAHFFVSVEQDEDEMWGPLPPKIPTKKEHNERHQQGLRR